MQWPFFFFNCMGRIYLGRSEADITSSLMLFHACCIVSYVNGKRKHHSRGHSKGWT